MIVISTDTVVICVGNKARLSVPQIFVTVTVMFCVNGTIAERGKRHLI